MINKILNGIMSNGTTTEDIFKNAYKGDGVELLSLNDKPLIIKSEQINKDNKIILLEKTTKKIITYKHSYILSNNLTKMSSYDIY